MVNLYFYSFNNVENRNIIYRRTLAEYAQDLIHVISNVSNFNPGDGVNTTQVLNKWNAKSTPNYMLAVDEYGEIANRWFVYDATYDRRGQYVISLKRDTIADFWEETKNAVTYIRRGFVSPESPLVFQDENITLNKIKKHQVSIKNLFGCPWIVAYLARKDASGALYRYNGTFSLNDPVVYGEYASFDEAPYNSYRDIETAYMQSASPDYEYYTVVREGSQLYLKYDLGNNFLGSSDPVANAPVLPITFTLPTIEQRYQYLIACRDAEYKQTSDYDPLYSDVETYATLQTINALTNRVYKIAGKYYKLQNTYVGESTRTAEITTAYPALYSEMGKVNTELLRTRGGTPVFTGSVKVDLYRLEYIPYADTDTYEYDFTITDAITSDAPYEIIAMPYGNATWSIVNSDSDRTYPAEGAEGSGKELAVAFMSSLKTAYNSAVWDVQVVPYISWDNGVHVFNSNQAKSNYGWIKDTQQRTIDFFIHLPSCNVSALRQVYKGRRSVSQLIPQDPKTAIVTTECHIVSPNGNGTFSYNLARNGYNGNMIISCTLMPINPYIRICPQFSGLMGKNFDNEMRGLVCGGQFGIATVDNEWFNFQRNNVNFETIQQREIETMEISRKYQRIEQIASVVSGAGSAASSGFAIGGGVGAGIAGTLSAGAGVADFAISEKLYQRQKEDKQAFFELNLGNIGARSTQMTRTTAINEDNNGFPYLEIYECTKKEAEIAKSFLKYRGMSVNAIGTVGEYLEPGAEFTYIEGNIINMDIDDDGHVYNDIKQQIEGGVRLWQYNPQ